MPAEENVTKALPQVTISPPTPQDFWNTLIIVTIFACIALVTYSTFAAGMFDHLVELARNRRWGELILRPTVLWVSMGLLLLVFRTVLWLRYRPFPSVDPADAPYLTVIIPAYNEGRMVEKSIDSVAAAHYPRERLQIIVVDDGSTDDTRLWIARAAGRHSGLVTAIQFERNRGKRAALAEGFRRARGEIVVTIDSDSVIKHGALLALAGPFRNPRVGAVAGKVSVFNRHRGIFPRMLNVRFVLSFDFLRSVQSAYGTVYCCPGALAAYRAGAVQQVLEQWQNQRFLGAACTYGEDRALTNYILALGYDTVYQGSAVVHTVVPETYSKLCKMYLRWDRSYVREEIRFLRIVWKRPWGPCLIALVEKTFTNLRYPVAYAALALWFSIAVDDPIVVLRMLYAIGIASTFYMLYYLRSERSWDFVFGILYAYLSVFALSWILPYAALTVRSRAWLTR
jgi:hyaluronan synthase